MRICELDYRARRIKFYNHLEKQEIAGYFTDNLVNIRYMTGFTGTAAALFFTKSRIYMLLDGRYQGSVREDLPEADDLEIVPVDRANSRFELLGKLIKKGGLKRLHFERNNLLYNQFRKILQTLPAVERIYGEDLISRLRQVKTAAEIKLISEALYRTEELFELVESWIEPGITERQLHRALRRELESRSAGQAFTPLVLFGRRTACPHASASAHRLAAGEPVLVDMGLKLQGYCSDLTRMFFPGKETAVFDLYRLSEEITLKLAEKMVPGVKCSEIAKQGRQLVERAGYSGAVLHGPGHGLGLEVHERPSLSENSSGVLESGMVLTLEPGIYCDGVGGGRIEHVVHLGEAGPEFLDRTADRGKNC